MACHGKKFTEKWGHWSHWHLPKSVSTVAEDNVANENLVSLESARWEFNGMVGWILGTAVVLCPFS